MGLQKWYSMAIILGMLGMVIAMPHMRQGPPIPPGFEKILPKDVLQKLQAIHENHNLTFPEKHEEINKIFSNLPDEILDKIPLPPGFEKLPQDVQNQFKAIHKNKSLDWRQKHEKIHDLIRNLSEDQRRLLPPPPPPPPFMLPLSFGPHPPHFGRGFPPRPPPGFEKVLSSDIYQRLVAIHEDKNMTNVEKMDEIDQIMKEIPKETLEKLPLPPGFDRLPEEAQKQARAIFFNFTIPFKDRMRGVKKFVKNLPKEQRRRVRPQPPGFELLPQETRDKIDEIFEDESLGFKEKHEKIREIIDALPDDIRKKLPLPPGPPFGGHGPMPPMPPPFGMPPPPFVAKLPPPPPPTMEFE